MPHTIQIPDWLWEKAQKKFNMETPATPLRDILFAAAADWKVQPTKTNNQPAKKWGSQFIAGFDSACKKCGKRIITGSYGFKCDAGNMHPECYDQWAEEQGGVNG